MKESDYLIIGSGVAGLSLALGLAPSGSVSLVTKKSPADSSTNLAQGGIASVLDPHDSFDLHIGDTLASGVGLCRPGVVEAVVREGPDRIDDLRTLGVPFTSDSGGFDLGLEGGHSHKRIVHCDDLTGREVERHLLDAVHAHDNIDMFAHHMAIHLVEDRHLRHPSGNGNTVFGAYVLDEESGSIEAFAANRTILATGGAGKAYLYTTNPDIATGDGVAMAFRAGARITNLEFVQFHPTCLHDERAKSFLLSEALRGEGGRLIGRNGHTFMSHYDKRGELAPRDIVARAIDTEMKRTGDPCVFLDMTDRDARFLRNRFPNITGRLADLGYDIAHDPIPVVPATHYFCGGVDVDVDGRTSVRNLYALGEVSHTGLHGANRLASNSLLEAIVFARRTMSALKREEHADRSPHELQSWREGGSDEEPIVLEHDWDSARRVMWDYVGIVRSDRRLGIARQRMRALRATVETLYWTTRATSDLLELRNIILVGQLVIESALLRKESRGLHFTETFPDMDDKQFRRDTNITIGDVEL